MLNGCANFMPILGSTRGWSDSSEIIIIKDINVSGLRIRVTQPKNNVECVSGTHHTIEIDGPINKDTSFALEKIYKELPECVNKNNRSVVKSVYMNSYGGTLDDGYAIGNLFRKYGASTKISEGQVCASSCAVAFLGGAYRSVNFDGKLLFHAPYIKSEYGRLACVDKKSAAAEKLKSYYIYNLGNSGERLFDRTMDYCSQSDGWTIDKGAAKLFGITNN